MVSAPQVPAPSTSTKPGNTDASQPQSTCPVMLTDFYEVHLSFLHLQHTFKTHLKELDTFHQAIFCTGCSYTNLHGADKHHAPSHTRAATMVSAPQVLAPSTSTKPGNTDASQPQSSCPVMLTDFYEVHLSFPLLQYTFKTHLKELYTFHQAIFCLGCSYTNLHGANKHHAPSHARAATMVSAPQVPAPSTSTKPGNTDASQPQSFCPVMLTDFY